MAYDEKFADRIRKVVGPRVDVSERKMFGGVAFLLDGKMFCGIASDDLMVRVGPERYEAALAEPGARPMDFTGRPMNGYVFVNVNSLRSEAALKKWVDLAMAFVATVKKAAPKKPQRAVKKRAPR
jgi:TfoX/Sxy family transcriptional regulator of competence genes